MDAELFEPGHLHQPFGGEADHLIGRRKRLARDSALWLPSVRPARSSRAGGVAASPAARGEARLPLARTAGAFRRVRVAASQA